MLKAADATQARPYGGIFEDNMLEKHILWKAAEDLNDQLYVRIVATI